ncbi:MAG: sterol desaturase family protein [Cytophagaceae bacterium]|nr:sterol desaturase family protein [Cytophagaceae bacterium]MDW8455463.1 sterol desaturase family protein [Cytophagaceae bacterium]
MEIMEKNERKRPSHEESGKFSDNIILDKITRTHISVPLIILMSVASAFMYHYVVNTSLSRQLIVPLFVSGFIFFTFLEYVFHRYLFHISTDTPFKKKLQYKIHGLHHDYPKDKTRLAMNPIFSLTLTGLFYLLFKAILGDMVYAFLPGVISGYCMYISIHYIVHSFPPPKNFFRHLWINHAIHHYRDETTNYGVSSPLWDYIFGTTFKKKLQNDT